MAQETVKPDKQAQEQAAQYAQQHTAQKGGREWVNTIDGLKQYPDMLQFTTLPMFMITNHAPIERN